MAECARQPILELYAYLVVLNDLRSSSHYVRSLKIFFNSFFVLEVLFTNQNHNPLEFSKGIDYFFI